MTTTYYAIANESVDFYDSESKKYLPIADLKKRIDEGKKVSRRVYFSSVTPANQPGVLENLKTIMKAEAARKALRDNLGVVSDEYDYDLDVSGSSPTVMVSNKIVKIEEVTE